MARLKVFATTSGIRDHVVAVPSRPAALRAWGAKTDLFSMGVAKQVTDPKVVEKALERPGEVISLDRSGEFDKAPARTKNAGKKPAPRPPSGAKLAAAERLLERLEEKQANESMELDRALAALTRKREQLEKRHAKERRAGEEKVAEARDAYQAALDNWEG